MTVTMESAVFMGKNYLNSCQSIVNTTDLTLKQMFDVNKMRFLNCFPLVGKIIHGNLSLIGDERIIHLQRTKIYVFSDSVLCLGKIHENPQSNGQIGVAQNISGIQKLGRIRRRANGGIFPGFKTLQLSEEVKRLLYRLRETPEIS